jgi:hypothetical protein
MTPEEYPYREPYCPAHSPAECDCAVKRLEEIFGKPESDESSGGKK